MSVLHACCLRFLVVCPSGGTGRCPHLEVKAMGKKIAPDSTLFTQRGESRSRGCCPGRFWGKDCSVLCHLYSPSGPAITSQLLLVFYALYLGTTKNVWFHFNKLYKQALPLAHPHIHIYKRKGNLPFTSQKWHCCYREFVPSE